MTKQNAERFVFHDGDLPDDAVFGDTLAIDSEFMGLNVARDRLCLLQIYDGQPESKVHIIRFARGGYAAPNVRKLMADARRRKLFFYARADMKWIGHYLGVIPENVHCLRIASRLARSNTQAHGLEDVIRHLLDVRISKEQQCTDWGRDDLSPAQLDYACNDVLYLHAIDEKLADILRREDRLEISEGLSRALPAVVRADLAGWANEDLFGYHIPKAG